MPAFLENWMGPCLRRDDLLKKQTLHQHIEKHYPKNYIFTGAHSPPNIAQPRNDEPAILPGTEPGSGGLTDGGAGVAGPCEVAFCLRLVQEF